MGTEAEAMIATGETPPEHDNGSPPGEWPKHGVSFREAIRTWLYVGLLSFGGPAAQIAVMHRVVVDEKRWIGEQRFLHALNFCMLLPGPEAMQLATYIGWLMHRTRGALAAGLLFILPGFVCMLALGVLYASSSRYGLVELLFYGVKPAVVAIVVQAVIRIGGRALPSPAMVAVAGASFAALFFFRVPFPAVVIGAILTGLIGAAMWPETFKPLSGHKGKAMGTDTHPLLPDDAVLPVSRSPLRAMRVAAVWLVIWFAPLAIAAALFGPRSVITTSGLFFSKAAVVTFGGAYAVLGYVAQHAPEVGWVTRGEMLDGLGLAETTPGPLILVLQFVGHLGCFRHPPMEIDGAMLPLTPFWSGLVGATLATWMTFAPCFMWIFLGAPYMERLRHNRRLGSALACVTAAVVGVVLALALWFATHVFFRASPIPVRFGPVRFDVPTWASFDLWSAGLAFLAAYLIFRLRWGLFAVVGTCVLAGVAVRLALMVLHWNPD
ncbi:MAG: chromate efflux transporter [Phycisphaeraceae bacterium]|nr:MAG: chromate efflux transporter [Phycisphaeraceae bacterium]